MGKPISLGPNSIRLFVVVCNVIYRQIDTLLGTEFRKLTLISTEAVRLEYNSKIYNTMLVKH